jgi:hypothetical protein
VYFGNPISRQGMSEKNSYSGGYIGLDGREIQHFQPQTVAQASAAPVTYGAIAPNDPSATPAPAVIPAEPVSAAKNSKTYLDLNLASHHFVDKRNPAHRVWEGNRSEPYNEKNLGIGVTHMREVWRSEGGALSASLGASVGYYRNSLYRDSVYAVANAEATYKATPTVSVGIGAQAGIVTGYVKDVTPAGQIYARIEKDLGNDFGKIKSVFAQFGVIPPVTTRQVSTPATATMRVGISF